MFLKRIWERWKNFSLKIWNFNTRLILTLFYLIFISPISIFIRIFGNPLKVNRKKDSNWLDPEDLSYTLEKAGEQY